MRFGKKFILSAFLVVVLLGGMMGAACGAAEDVEEELDGGSQEDMGGNIPPGGVSPGMGLSEELLVRVAEMLDIDQQDLADAFEQAQSEVMGDMPEDMQLPEDMSPEDMPEDMQPPEGMPPEDMPEDMPEDGMPPGDMHQGGMSPGMGLSEDLLARVAEILDIDQQELADAIELAQEEIGGETAPPASAQ